MPALLPLTSQLTLGFNLICPVLLALVVSAQGATLVRNNVCSELCTDPEYALSFGCTCDLQYLDGEQNFGLQVGDEDSKLSGFREDFERLMRRYLSRKMLLEYTPKQAGNSPFPGRPQGLVVKRGKPEISWQPLLFLKKRYGDFDYGLELPWQTGQRGEGLTEDQQKKVFRYGK